jgi:hypothetical protein
MDHVTITVSIENAKYFHPGLGNVQKEVREILDVSLKHETCESPHLDEGTYETMTAT